VAAQVVHPSRDVDLARTLLLDCLRDLICRLRAWKVRDVRCPFLYGGNLTRHANWASCVPLLHSMFGGCSQQGPIAAGCDQTVGV